MPKSSFQVLRVLHLFCKLCSRLPDNKCKVCAYTRVQGHPVLQHELERVRAGKAMEPLDTSRFHLAPPATNKQNDFAAWRQATDNAHSQLEHQYNRYCGQPTTTLITSSSTLNWTAVDCKYAWHLCSQVVLFRLMNLELLLRFGSNARRVHIKSLEGHIARCDADAFHRCLTPLRVLTLATDKPHSRGKTQPCTVPCQSQQN